MDATDSRSADEHAVNATLSITCPDWCQTNAQTHADELHEWDGGCLHRGVLALVHDTTGRGTDWSPWQTHAPLVSPAIEVGVGPTTTPCGMPTHTPSIHLGDGVHPIEQVEALIAVLQQAVELAKAQHPDWKLE